MKYTEFKNTIENGSPYSVYLLEGEDAFFRERGLALLKKGITEPSLNVCIFDGATTDVSEIKASLCAYPFLSEKRLTAVREFYPKTEGIGVLKEYLNSPSKDSIFAIINEKTSESLKKFSSVCVVDCGKSDSALLAKWIRTTCANNNVIIDGERAKLLAEYCNSDMTRIDKETEKLVSYVGNGGSITKKEIDEMVSRDVEYKIYEMTDYIGRKKFDLALSVIKDMLGKGETSQRIIISVYNYFRRLLHVAISDLKASELATLLGIKEFAIRKTIEQASMFKKRALKNAVDTLSEADYKIKSGHVDADEQMWLSIFYIMTEK